MWQAVRELGFTEGRVLEPGCGAGIFLGIAPEGARLTGVELDPTTASIAAPGPQHVARRRPPAGKGLCASRDGATPVPAAIRSRDQQVSPTDS